MQEVNVVWVLLTMFNSSREVLNTSIPTKYNMDIFI